MSVSSFPEQRRSSSWQEKEEPYKVQLIEDLPEDAVISFYKQGEFHRPLCRPSPYEHKAQSRHLSLRALPVHTGEETKRTKCFQEFTVQLIQRQLILMLTLQCLKKQENVTTERLGKELKLFALLDEGPGFPFFLPNGMIIKNTLIDYWREIHTKSRLCRSFRHLLSLTDSFGKEAVTGITTKKICIQL